MADEKGIAAAGWTGEIEPLGSDAMSMASAVEAPPPLSEFLDRGPVALFLDFDGTLVDIAETPDAITVPATLALRLEQLGTRLAGRLALVSGRSLDNLKRHLGPVKLVCAGSHGIDLRRADGSIMGVPATPLPPVVMEEVARFALENPNVLLEAKSHGAALHFRASPELEGPVAAFAQVLAERFALRLIRGKCVVELVRGEADKANAVRMLMQDPDFAGALPVFVGDDVTDEDGFRAVADLGGIGILVGARPGTWARYRLRNPHEVHAWLTL